MSKFYSVVGTRPEIIRVIRGLKDHFICDTGQHYDAKMAGDLWAEQGLEPDICLEKTTYAGIFTELDKMFSLTLPKYVLVYGDTRSSLAAAQAATDNGVKVIHLESGGRASTEDAGVSSEPEERYRRTIDHLSSYLCVANSLQKTNLISEGISADRIKIVGDTLYDRFLEWNSVGKYALVTIHRKENHSREQIEGLLHKLDLSKPIKVIGHPGMTEFWNELRKDIPDTVEYLDPVNHKQMLELIRGANVVLTDSGGVQREAHWMGKRLIIAQSKSPWIRELFMFGDGSAEVRVRNFLLSLP